MLRSGYLGFGVPAVGKALGTRSPLTILRLGGLLVQCGLLVGGADAVEVAA